MIQSADANYIFGAYIAVSWPKSADVNTVIADPSCSSFMFSLVNEYARPFRMSLNDQTRAISVSANNIVFGGEVRDSNGKCQKFPNVILNYHGRLSNVSNGNASNDPMLQCAYQLDEWTSESPEPLGFKLDDTTLTGSHCFAASEIEVYVF